MRLWHQKLLKHLPQQWLLGQHRELCALRGKGWEKNHATVDYIFDYSLERLSAFHLLVIDVGEDKYNIAFNNMWTYAPYRGKELGCEDSFSVVIAQDLYLKARNGEILYDEHNQEYLEECLENIKNKGVYIDLEEVG